MDASRVVSTGLVALILTGCTAGPDSFNPTAPTAARSPLASVSPNAARPTQTAGTFDAIVDFPTITLTPKAATASSWSRDI